MASKVQTKFPKSGAIRSDAAIRRRAAKRGVTFEEQLKSDLDKAEEARTKRAAAKEEAGEKEAAVKEAKVTVGQVSSGKDAGSVSTVASGVGIPAKVVNAAAGVPVVALKIKKERTINREPPDGNATPKRKAEKITGNAVDAPASSKRKKATFAYTTDTSVATSKLEEFIAANELDAKCVRALARLTEEQLKVVLKRANRTTVDFSKGNHSLLITAMCKQARPVLPKLEPLPWPEQAGEERVEYNRLLRERYAKQPEAMTEAEIERAKVLIARDDRKKEKKQSCVGSMINLQKPTNSKRISHIKGQGRGGGVGSGRGSGAVTGRGRGGATAAGRGRGH